MKKQILIVTSEFPPQPGGIGNHAYNLALYLSKADYDVRVIADQRSLTGAEEVVFDKELPFTVIRISRNKQRFKMYFKRIVATYKGLKNASTVIATGKFSLWNVGFLSLFFKAQCLAVVHGTEVNFKPLLLKKSIAFALKRMDTVVAVSNYTKGLIDQLNINVEVIPNGIDVASWQREDFSDLELIGNPILTTVGRVSTRKGQLNVIKQLPELVKQFPELHYHCVGIPTEADTFLEEAKSLAVATHITFHGSVAADRLKQILASTDIFIMLSTESVSGDVEGFGIAILEANAMGIPAIGAKGCGIEDAIKPNVSGVLVDLNSSSPLIHSIDNILQNKAVFEQGATDWSNAHDWSIIIKRYIALLR